MMISVEQCSAMNYGSNGSIPLAAHHGGVAKAVVFASCPISRSFLKEEMFMAAGCNVSTYKMFRDSRARQSHNMQFMQGFP